MRCTAQSLWYTEGISGVLRASQLGFIKRDGFLPDTRDFAVKRYARDQGVAGSY